MKKGTTGLVFLLLVVLVLAVSCSGGKKVESAEDLAKVLQKARPGDTIILADGIYTDELFIIDASGSEEKPLTFRAQTPGQAILTGSSRLRIGGDYVVVDGLYFKDGSLAGDQGGVVEFRRPHPDPENEGVIPANHSTLKNTVIAYYNNSDRKVDYKWVSLYGTYNTVTQCEIIGKNHSGTSMAVWRDDDSPQYHHISYNKFMYIEDDEDGNGAEALRVGTSQRSLSDSFTTVEYNWFEQCNGEIEIISNKSGNNTYRGNTFVNSSGMLTLRHGDNCTVEGNFFFGGGYYGTGGIRVIGENHVIQNNYVQDIVGDGGTFRSAICLTNGIDEGPLNGYFQVKNALVTGNILVNNERNFIIGGGASSKLTLPPRDSRIEGNIVIADSSTRPLVQVYAEAENLTWDSNVMSGADPGVDPKTAGIDFGRVRYEMVDGLVILDTSYGLAAQGRPLGSQDAGADWTDADSGMEDYSFRARNLYEEAYQKQVVLPWSKLAGFAGENGIIVTGADSADVFINSIRFKYDIRDPSLTPLLMDGTLMIPRAFLERRFGDAPGEGDYLSLDEVAEAWNRAVYFDERGFAIIAEDEDTIELLTIKANLEKMADLYKVVSSRDDGNVPSNALDGLLATRWSADGDGQWLRFDLREELVLGSAEIAFYKGDERSTFFEVQVSDDRETWSTVFEGQSSGESDKFEEFNLPDTSARFVRIVGHMNSASSWNSISEVQFFAPDGEPLMDYVKAKADIYEERVMEQVEDIQLEGTPVSPVHDAFVEIAHPDTVFGLEDKIRVKAKLDNSIVRISYVMFNLSEVSAVNSANFQISGMVSTNNPANPLITIDVYGIEDDSWDEKTITWNNSPNHAPDSTEVVGLGESVTHLGSFEMSGPGLVKKYVVDVSEFAKLQKEQDGVMTLMLVDSNIQNLNCDPYSKERSSPKDRPYLFIQ